VIDLASLTVRLGSGLWNWSLTSRDLKVGFSGFSPTLAGLFDQVEQQLSAPNVPYRKVGRGEMHLRKRKL